MSVKVTITKIAEAFRSFGRWVEGLTVPPRPHAAPVPIRYGDFSQLTAKEQGEWYLHTLTGR